MGFEIENGVLEKYTEEEGVTEVVIPNSVTSIGWRAFVDCSSLTSITIPDSVTSIGGGAFRGCSSLTSITIPDSVTSIGNNAFNCCNSLESLNVSSNNTKYSSVDGALYNEDQSQLIVVPSAKSSIMISDSVTSVGDYAFEDCSSLTSITIPDSVTSIGKSAFRGCSSLTSITIPSLVTSIGESAFSGSSSLTSITIPDSVTSIGDYAFYECESLTSITIPDSVTSIGNNAFNCCNSLESLNVSSNNTKYSSVNGVLYNKDQSQLIVVPSAKSSITIPDSVILIDYNAFSSCSSLASINVSSNNKRYCSYDSVLYSKDKSQLIVVPSAKANITFPDSVTSIDNCAFSRTKWLEKQPKGMIIVGKVLYKYTGKETEVVIPDSVTSIRKDAFEGNSSLTSITIPDSVTSIEWGAFSDCSSLTSITIPDSVKSIGEYAFSGCNKLQTIVWNDPKCKLNENMFSWDSFSNILLNIKSNTPGWYMFFSDAVVKKDIEKNQYTAKEYAAVFIRKNSKSIQKEIINRINQSNAADVGSAITDMIDDESSIKECSNAAFYFTSFAEILPEDVIKAVYEKLRNAKNGKNAADALENDLNISSIINAASDEKQKDENSQNNDILIIQDYVKEYFKNNTLNPDILTISRPKKTVYYKNSEITCNETVLNAFLNEYSIMFKKYSKEITGMYSSRYDLVDGTCLVPSDTADHIASFLDIESLRAYLLKGAASKDYRYYIIACARHLAEEDVNNYINHTNPYSSSKAKGKIWDTNAISALYISDTIGAMQYFDKKNLLDSYAKMRGMSAQEIRDLRMIPDFGFDSNGKIYYEADDLKLSVKILPDTSLELCDEVSGKILKSVPKKGADPEKLEKIRNSFTSLKKETKKFVKSKVDNLCKLHLDGGNIELNVWRKVYIDNPLIKQISSGLVWMDSKNNFFTVSAAGIIDVNGTAYEPDSKIKVAHAMDLSMELLKNWQDYFVKNEIKQPFEQVWEPIVDLTKINIENRYNRLELTSDERSDLKKALNARGIDVYSDSMEAYYDYTQGKYIYDEWNIMHLGEYIAVQYIIEDDKSIRFDHISIEKNLERPINAIVYELEKIMIRKDILNDDINKVTLERLSAFTLAQIQDFINLSTENGSVNCTAVLLDYKNKTFPDFDPMEAFTLDW